MSRRGATAPVRVLHVVHHLQPGGMEYGLIKLVNGLAGGPIESMVCSTSAADPQMARQLAPGVRLVELRRRGGNDPRLVWQLYRLFRRERPDIVHTHAWGTLIEGLIAARLARVPVVMHGEHGTLQLKPYQVRVQRWAWLHVDRLLSVSSRLAEKMSAAVGIPRECITVIRNGVDLSRFSSVTRVEARADLGIDDGVVVIGHAGRLVPVKDQAALVHAASLLRQHGLTFRVLIAGEGPLRADLERLVAELGVTDCVTLLGHRSDLERFYAALDVYVLCSRSEGMPNTILEAMASGVTVVSTNVGGADELVLPERTGALVPPARPDLLADAVRAMMTSSPLRESMGLAGRLRAQELFGVATMVENYKQLYVRSSACAAQRDM